MAATRWAQVLLYDYGRRTDYIPSEKVINFQKVRFTLLLLRERNLTAVELHRSANHILLQCGLHQSLSTTSLPPHIRRRFGLSLGSRNLSVPNHGLFYRLCHRDNRWLLACLVLLV